MKLSVSVQKPFLFKGAQFKKEEWSPINFLVGPNGTGKSHVFDEIMNHARRTFPNAIKKFTTSRLVPIDYQRSLRPIWGGDLSPQLFPRKTPAEIYVSTSEDSHEAYLLLETRRDLQIKITALLEQIFGRKYEFAYDRGILKIFGLRDSSRYSLEDECHGLKELVTILTFIYSDQYKIIGIDEPELHLHPQFQYYLMQEIRKVAGDPLVSPDKKCFFIVTHSPVILDVRSLEDLSGVLIFNSLDSLPKFIQLDSFGVEKKKEIRRVIPHLNAYKRELFFATRPVFVEGPYDAMFFELIAQKLEIPYGAAGISIIPMGGKDMFSMYWELCNLYGKDFAAVLDLDCLIEGQAINKCKDDPRIVAALQESGHAGRDIQQILGEVQGDLNTVGRAWIQRFSTNANDTFLQSSEAHKELEELLKKADHSSDVGKKVRYVLLATIQRTKDSLKRADPEKAEIIEGIASKTSFILSILKKVNTYVHIHGSTESHFTQSQVSHSPNDYQKRVAFIIEIDYISQLSADQIVSFYRDLTDILKDVLNVSPIELKTVVERERADLVHEIQKAFHYFNVRNIEQIKTLPQLIAEGYWQVFDLTAFEVDGNNFRAELRTLSAFGGDTYSFTMDTVPSRSELQ